MREFKKGQVYMVKFKNENNIQYRPCVMIPYINKNIPFVNVLLLSSKDTGIKGQLTGKYNGTIDGYFIHPNQMHFASSSKDISEYVTTLNADDIKLMDRIFDMITGKITGDEL